MAVEGKLDLLGLPEILQTISQQRKTGILTVQGEEDIVAVSFSQGRIVGADALNEAAMDGAGGVLVEQGMVRPELLQQLAARAEREGKRLADLLVEEGHVERREMLEALRAQTARLLLSLLDWDRGDFKFYAGEEVSFEEGFRSLGVDELLLRALDDSVPTRGRSVPGLDSRLRRLSSGRPVALRHPRSLTQPSAEPADERIVWVTPDEQRVLEAVSPDRTVEEIAEAAGVGEDRVRYVLFRFLRDGLVAPVQAPASAAHRDAPGPESRSRREAAASSGVPLDGPAGSEPEASATRIEAPETAVPALPGRAIAAVAALAAALLLVSAVVAVPVAFLLPFPWLEAERAAFHEQRDAAHALELDLAAKTFFLLQGRFPDDLQELVAAGLLERADAFDSLGRRLAYEPRERSYEVRPLVAEATRPGVVLGFREGIAENFLLDPDLLRVSAEGQPSEPALVLLD